MRNLLVCFILFPVLSFSQELKNNFYTNSDAGFSISFSKEWQVKAKEIKTAPLSAYNESKNEIVSIGLAPVSSSITPQYSKEEADAAKPQIINALKQRGVTIDKISVSPGSFLGRKCLITVAYIKDPGLFDGKQQYYRTIQFVHSNYMFNIICGIPISNFSDSNLKFVDTQLQTMKFF